MNRFARLAIEYMRMGALSVDRRLAELSGKCKALSEELQAQIRRFDQMGATPLEWRLKRDEDICAKFTEIKYLVHQTASMPACSRPQTRPCASATTSASRVWRRWPMIAHATTTSARAE